MPTPPDTPRDALYRAAYEFARELVRALELDTLDGAATGGLSCGVTLEFPTDGTAPRIRLDLTSTAVDPASVVKPPACGEAQNGKAETACDPEKNEFRDPTAASKAWGGSARKGNYSRG